MNTTIELTTLWLACAMFFAFTALDSGRLANKNPEIAPGRVFVAGFSLSAACTFTILFALSL
jgi:hypothetical protein